MQAFDVSRERKTLMMWQPYMLGLAFDLEHLPIDAAPPTRLKSDETIAFTNGRAVYYGKRYSTLTQAERNFIFLHELLHGVFKHPERMARIYLVRGFIVAILANYASDAIINEAIIADPMAPDYVFAIPERFPPVRMATIHQIMSEARMLSGATLPGDYDPAAIHGQNFESVYEWLLWARDAVTAARKEQAKSADLDSVGSAGSSMIERILDQEEAWDIDDDVATLLDNNGGTVSNADLIQTANETIASAKAKLDALIQGLKMSGEGKGSSLLSLEGDLPRALIPWHSVLRRRVTKSLSTELATSYTKPGPVFRSSLALRRKAAFTPGTTIYTDRPRVLIALDVSGSQIPALQQCLAEIWKIASKRLADIDLVTFDDGVQETIRITKLRDLTDVVGRGLKGGGGTMLGDLFQEAREMRTPYRSIIIVTDGYLTPPAETLGLEILWVVTPGGSADALAASGAVVRMPAQKSA